MKSVSITEEKKKFKNVRHFGKIKKFMRSSFIHYLSYARTKKIKFMHSQPFSSSTLLLGGENRQNRVPRKVRKRAKTGVIITFTFTMGNRLELFFFFFFIFSVPFIFKWQNEAMRSVTDYLLIRCIPISSLTVK